MLTLYMVYKNLILRHLGEVRLTSRVIGGQQSLTCKFIRYFDSFDILWTLEDLWLSETLNDVNFTDDMKNMILLHLGKVRLTSRVIGGQ